MTKRKTATNRGVAKAIRPRSIKRADDIFNGRHRSLKAHPILPSRFVKNPFTGWVRRKTSTGKWPKNYNFVDHLAWKHFQTFLNREDRHGA